MTYIAKGILGFLGHVHLHYKSVSFTGSRAEINLTFDLLFLLHCINLLIKHYSLCLLFILLLLCGGASLLIFSKDVFKGMLNTCWLRLCPS